MVNVMNFIKNQKIRLAQFLMAIFVAVSMLFSSVAPANALGSDRSNLRSGEAKLDKIYEKSEDALRTPPLSPEKAVPNAVEGINEVQGAADAEKMKRPENSQQATSVEEQIKKTLEKATNKS